jgi:hypothetical protein
MKNVTITLDDVLAVRARVEAAGRGKSLSKFVGELIEREIGRDERNSLETIEEFFRGPGYPGISKNWRGREELYAERENKLLRGHQPADLRPRSQGAGKKNPGRRPHDPHDQERPARTKRPKP